MRILFGLGNPGKRYKNNRHNVGFMVIDKLIENLGLSFKRSLTLQASLVKSKIYDEEILFVKPLGYMNNSGRCVGKVLKKYKVSLNDALIIYDDVDLSLGEIRFRNKGSAAGHRGMSSIIETLGDVEISRLRVGVCRPKNGDLADYVLSDFEDEDRELLEETLKTCESASLDWIKKDAEFVMQNYNRIRQSP